MSHIRRVVETHARAIRSHPILAVCLLLLAGFLLPVAGHAAGLHGSPSIRPDVQLGPGVVHLDQRLMLNSRQWAVDQQGPTMDQMFPPGGFAMHHPILVWWLILELLGLIAFPFTFLFLANLVDRGFIIAKTVGLVLVVYVVWIAVSVGLTTYDRDFIWLVVGTLALISAGTALRLRNQIAAFLRLEWKRLLAGELVFLVAFAIFLGLRMWYPDLGHQFSPVSPDQVGSGRMGEKQMEMAFLNAIVRSRVFPPLDPFFAHGYINYYYFGFVLVGTLCKLTQIIPATGFNLAIATFFAMLLGNSFSVILAITRRIVPGVIGAILVGLIGNLNGAWQLMSGLMQVATVHSDLYFFGGLADILSGLKQVLIAHQQLQPFDFWGPTRIIPPVGAPISEFPYFSYLFADLHPHLVAFPLTVAAVAFGVNLALGSAGRVASGILSLLLGGVLLGAIEATNPWDFPTYLAVVALGAFVGAYAVRRRLHWSLLTRPLLWGGGLLVTTGVLYLPFERSYRTVFTTGIGLAREIPPTAFQSYCSGDPATCSQTVREALITPLHIYLEHFGLFAFIVLSYLVVLMGTRAGGFARWQRWVTWAQFFIYHRHHYRRLPHAAGVVRRMRGAPEPVADISIVLGVILVVAGLLAFQYFLLAFLFALIGLIVLLFARLGRSLPEQQLLVLSLLLIPLALSIGTQVFYIRDFLDMSAYFRMNTIFKFYNQAWVLFALASAMALYFLFVELTPEPVEPPTLPPAPEPAPSPSLAPEPALVGSGTDLEYASVPPESVSAPIPIDAVVPRAAPAGWRRVQSFLNRHATWSAALGILVAASLIYTYAGTVARETYRTSWLPEGAVPFTLDGMAFMKVTYPEDYTAINWLNAHVTGAPVIAEAYTAYGYTWPSRVSMFTGLPDIFNGIHEQEQRYGDELDPTSLCSSAPRPSACLSGLHSRQDDLATLFNSPNQSDAWRVIRAYGVRYIYVGWAETHCLHSGNGVAVCYSPNGIAKFHQMVGHGLQVAFHTGNTSIYRVTRYG